MLSDDRIRSLLKDYLCSLHDKRIRFYENGGWVTDNGLYSVRFRISLQATGLDAAIVYGLDHRIPWNSRKTSARKSGCNTWCNENGPLNGTCSWRSTVGHAKEGIQWCNSCFLAINWTLVSNARWDDIMLTGWKQNWLEVYRRWDVDFNEFDRLTIGAPSIWDHWSVEQVEPITANYRTANEHWPFRYSAIMLDYAFYIGLKNESKWGHWCSLASKIYMKRYSVGGELIARRLVSPHTQPCGLWKAMNSNIWRTIRVGCFNIQGSNWIGPSIVSSMMPLSEPIGNVEASCV